MRWADFMCHFSSLGPVDDIGSSEELSKAKAIIESTIPVKNQE